MNTLLCFWDETTIEFYLIQIGGETFDVQGKLTAVEENSAQLDGTINGNKTATKVVMHGGAVHVFAEVNRNLKCNLENVVGNFPISVFVNRSWIILNLLGNIQYSIFLFKKTEHILWK